MKPPSENIKWIRANKGEGLSIEYYDKEKNKLIRRKDPAPPLSENEFNTLIKKMENYEGWHPWPWPDGEDYIPIQKVGGVKMSHHRVTEYLVINPPEERWVTREEAIQLAEKKQLRAVVVHSKKNTYLRPYPHETPYRDLIC